jgi:hypothetical protein
MYTATDTALTALQRQTQTALRQNKKRDSITDTDTALQSIAYTCIYRDYQHKRYSITDTDIETDTDTDIITKKKYRL